MVADGRMPDAGVKAPPRFDLWKPRRQRRWTQNNSTPQTQGRDRRNPPPQPMPTPAQPVPDFMPWTPGYVSNEKNLSDQLNATLQDITGQRMMIPGTIDKYMARSQNDEQWAHSSLDENLAGRGMVDSGTNPYLRDRDIYTPVGRDRQDFQAGIDDLLKQLALGESGAYLQYNQGLSDAMLQNAEDVIAQNPFSNQFPGSSPDYGAAYGLGNTKGPQKKDKPKKNKPRRNKPKGKK